MKLKSARQKCYDAMDKANGIKKPNKLPRPGHVIKELDVLVKALVKQRDNHTCQKCNLKVEGSNCHGSHVIPVSAGNKLRWDEQNIKVLCMRDHIYWWHKNPMEAAAWFAQKFPERWAYLQANKGIKKFTIFELLEMRDKFLERLKPKVQK